MLWDQIVDGADNIAYRLALTTLVARQRIAVGEGRRGGAASSSDDAAIRALAAAIADGDADTRTHRARDLLERSIPRWPRSSTTRSRSSCCCSSRSTLSFRHLDDDDDDLIGYDLRDTGTSLSMGIGNVVINVGWKLVVVAIYAALYELTPLRLDPHNPLTWVALFFADDLAYYWFHRVSHESRVFWASHVVHHSSQHYNLSTALRQTWVPMTYFPFWLPLPLLGFPVVDGAARPGLVADLPVLDPHRARSSGCRARSRRLQHAVAPPRPPRLQPRSTSTRTTAAS